MNTKVFSRGNNLIYELDMSNRQLRLMKDNIFLQEKELTEEIRLCYDRELAQQKMLLADTQHQFNEYRERCYAEIKKEVQGETHGIDKKMTQVANQYKDLEKGRKEYIGSSFKNEKQGEAYYEKHYGNQVNNTTVNINQVVMGQGSADPKLLEELD